MPPPHAGRTENDERESSTPISESDEKVNRRRGSILGKNANETSAFEKPEYHGEPQLLPGGVVTFDVESSPADERKPMCKREG